MRLLFSLILFFTTINVYSQKPKQVLGWINTAHSDNRNFYFEIPFEYRINEIIIQVTIGKETYDYIFDTGGYNDITDGIQKRNNFPVLTTQTVGSSNGIKSKINLVKVDSLKIGELVFKNIAALQMNFENSPTIKCTINGALIGASIIKNFIWQIDFSRRKIIVSDQLSKMPFINQSTKLPVTFNSRLMPFVEATLDGKKQKFMFDLGSSTQFILTKKSALQYISTKQPIEINGLSSEGGNGVLIQTANVFTADSIELANIKFKKKPVLYYQAGVENIIGNPIIKNFIVTLNFKDDELYLSPIAEANLTDGWNSFGFRAEYKNDKILVTSLFKGLSADKAALKIDDEIISVNRQKVDCKSYCECMAALSKMFEENTKLIIEVKSGQTIKEVTVTKDQVN